MWFEFAPRMSVGERAAKARREIEKRRKKGEDLSPVVIEGRKITQSFWGDAWCRNLEAYSDFASRLPRGRSYVTNGSVIDLQITPGSVKALVMGSELYKIAIDIARLRAPEWDKVKAACAGSIGSLVELLQGKLSKNVMEVVTDRERGLFPKPREIKLSCSCPDWADMCKHVAAALYGVGNRLDAKPELLFRLRGVDPAELMQEPVTAVGRTKSKGASAIKGDLGDVFGIDLAEPEEVAAPAKAARTRKPKSAPKKPAAKKRAAVKKSR